MSLPPHQPRHVLRGVLLVVAAACSLSTAAAQTDVADDSPAAAATELTPYFVAPMRLPNLADRIGYPQALTADPVTGEVFVCDTRGSRVIIFDEDALFDYQIVGGDLFSAPVDIAVDPDGILLLLANHQRRRAILELDFDGQFLAEIRIGGNLAAAAETGFSSLALSSSGGRLFVLDQDNLTLWIADRNGKVHNTVDLAEGLTERERQDMILGKVDVYGDRVVVTIPSRSIVRIFDLDGNLVGDTGIKGTAPCQIGFPMAAAMDVEGNLFIVDQQRMYLLRWDPETNACLGEYSGPGTSDGYMYYPLDIAVDPRGRVYVSQGSEGRVQAFGGFPAAAWGGSHPEAAAVTDLQTRKYTPRTADPLDAAEATLRSWSRARSEMMAEEFFGYYSADFQPVEPSDRGTWVDSQVVNRERSQLRISDLHLAMIYDDIVRATFVESHPSDPDWPRLEKTMLLRREQGGWKILEEHAVPLSAASDPPAPPSEE